jgi:hypothetical protein
MEVQFSCRTKGVTFSGSGCTKNLSSGEVIFEADRDLPEVGDVLLRIRWPFLLQSVCPLELVISGRIISSYAGIAVVHIEEYEFRTRGEQSFEAPIAKGTTCDFTA